MNIENLAKKLEGLQTVSSVCKLLNINRRTAINYISLLRKKGYVETSYGKRRLRMYRVRSVKRKKVGFPGLIETINKYSKIKLVAVAEERIHTHKLTIEEAIVRGIKRGRFRIVLVCLGLFNKVKNWHRLHDFAVKENIGRQVGALYDVARTVIKVRKMDARTRKALLRSKVDNKYVVGRIKSRDFKDIEKIWRIYLPFNKADLEVYKE